MRVFLIGYMGCGKSTLARKLAQVTGMQILDTDAAIEAVEKARVADIFRYEGEAYFRQREREVLERVLTLDDVIVSTGGGLPVWGDNMERMLQGGVTFYLQRSAAEILGRLSPYGRAKRPALRGLSDTEALAYMEHNLAEREPVYRRAAHVVECGGKSDEQIVNEILIALNEKTANS